MNKQQYINNYWDDAVKACAGTPIFPELALAESAIESSWGESYLTKEAHNFFGIKSTKSWEDAGGKYVVKPTHEFEDGHSVHIEARFRQYDNPEECFKNYVHFVTQPGYIACGVTQAGTPEEQARCIAKKYATDPAYADKIIATMHGLKMLLPLV